MDKVKANRAMTGDTILTTITSVIESVSGSWGFANYTSSVDYGSVLSFIESQVIIYDQSSLSSDTITGLIPSVSTSSSQRSFSFDLSAGNLAIFNSSLSGYAFENGDSIRIEAKYRVDENVAGLLKEATICL